MKWILCLAFIFHQSLLAQSATQLAKNSYTEFSWPKVPYVGYYLIEIYQDSLAKKLVLKDKAQTNNYRWPGAKQGVYYLRIASVDKWNQQGQFSALSELKVEFPDQINIPIELVSPANNHIVENYLNFLDFKWQESLNSLSYELLIAKDEDFSDIVFRRQTQQNKVLFDPEEMKIAKGNYYWMVLGKNGNKVSQKSTVREIEFVKIENSFDAYSASSLTLIKEDNKISRSFYVGPFVAMESIDFESVNGFGSYSSSISTLGAQMEYRHDVDLNSRADFGLRYKQMSASKPDGTTLSEATASATDFYGSFLSRLSNNFLYRLTIGFFADSVMHVESSEEAIFIPVASPSLMAKIIYEREYKRNVIQSFAGMRFIQMQNSTYYTGKASNEFLTGVDLNRAMFKSFDFSCGLVYKFSSRDVSTTKQSHKEISFNIGLEKSF